MVKINYMQIRDSQRTNKKYLKMVIFKSYLFSRKFDNFILYR